MVCVGIVVGWLVGWLVGRGRFSVVIGCYSCVSVISWASIGSVVLDVVIVVVYSVCLGIVLVMISTGPLAMVGLYLLKKFSYLLNFYVEFYRIQVLVLSHNSHLIKPAVEL